MLLDSDWRFLLELISGHRHMRTQSIKFLLGTLVFISLSGQLESDSSRRIADSLRPDVLIQTNGNADISGGHLLVGKLSQSADSSWSSQFELTTMLALSNLQIKICAHLFFNAFPKLMVNSLVTKAVLSVLFRGFPSRPLRTVLGIVYWSLEFTS